MIDETDQGYTFVACNWCKKAKAVSVYKGWTLLCKRCYRDLTDDDIYERNEDAISINNS